MPSGTHLTIEDEARILRLAGLTNPDGTYALTYLDISERLGIHQITVSVVVRKAAVKWGKRCQWKADPP